MEVQLTDDGLVPVFNWCKDVEDGAWSQVKNLARLPFAKHHIALMPDAHQGYGMPIGGILATEGVIVPNAVGLDIGCGVAAWFTNLDVEDVDTQAFMLEMMERVPVGFKWHDRPQNIGYLAQEAASIGITHERITQASQQFGTLGGGNHFIELDVDSNAQLWVLVHSGSRNIGKVTAEKYNVMARQLNKEWHSKVEDSWELAFLPMMSEEGAAYLKEMQWCQQFAMKNRERMIDEAAGALMKYNPMPACTESGVDLLLNVHHNYVAIEHHYGRNLMVHRKGAVRARSGEEVVIPGSMGSHSYIGVGLGSFQSFMSCSHGAGRAMGRKAAQRTLDVNKARMEMNSKHIRLYSPNKGDEWIAESREAYKDIDSVMAAQEDLVRIDTKLTPIAVLKA